MGIYEQVKTAFQDVVAPEIRRVDIRIDALDQRVTTAIDIRERLIALEAKFRTQ